MNLTFSPTLPLPALIALGLGIAVLVAALFWFRLRGRYLRGAAGVLLLAALFNPIIDQNENQKLTDITVIVVDHTDSQKITHRIEQTDQAVESLRNELELQSNTEVRIATVASSVDDTTGGTKAFAALAHAMSDIPPSRFAGAIIVTDGQVHDVPNAAALKNLQGPIHALITGSKKDSDRRLVIDHAPEYILVGDVATINFHVEDQGGNGADVPVSVSLPGEDPQKLVVKPGAAGEIKIPITHAGQNFISLSAEVRPGELSAANNTDLAIVNGIRDRLRVLLVSGQPNAGERTWRNLLKADTSVDLVHFTILRPAEKQDATPLNELSLIAFPTKELFEDKLTKFDLVIFDRYTRESVLPDGYLGNVADYVRNGGALLIASGPDFAEADGLASTPLDDVLAAEPTGQVIETPFKPKLSAIGEKHPITQDLKGASRTDPKWGQWFRLIDATPITSDGDTQVLLEGPDAKPLLVTRRVGKGRVAQLLSDQGWLWARGYDGGGPEADLLKRIAHWTMKQPELEEERIAAHGQGADIIVDRYGLKPNYESVTSRSPSGKESQVPLKEIGPGHFQGRFTPDEAGTYALLDGPLQAVTVAGNGDAKEVNDLLATPKMLEPATAATGGGTFWLEDGMPRLTTQGPSQSYAGAGFMALRANGETKTLAVRELDLFATLLSLAALLVLVSLMWRREGR